MNRRDFTRSLAALGLLPSLPSAGAAALAPVPATPAYTPYMYGLGAHMARSTGLCSVEMLSRKLALSPSAARAMQAQLLHNGIVSAPNAVGIAMTTQPYMASIRFKSVATTVFRATRRYLLENQEPDALLPETDSEPDPA